MQKLPQWLIKRTPKLPNIKKLRSLIGDPNIHTVCESAKCPNIGECYSSGTMTFMILGNICTRNCSFCAVEYGKPLPVDKNEPQRITNAVKKLKLKYVVVTSVTRDDLQDGGAEQFVKTINSIKKVGNDIKVEVLIPDFKGKFESLKKVVESKPDVLNHNIETVSRLYPVVRKMANYERSLNLIKTAKFLNQNICTKSGFMVGLGERFEEVKDLLKDLKSADCDIVTIGQYIPPSKNHFPVVEYIKPEVFKEYEKIALKLGFLKVFSGPFVRSSYKSEIIEEEFRKKDGRSN